jgi:hypothetical protein
MKTLLTTCLAFAVLVAPVCAQEETWDTRITGVSGEVTVRPVDGTPEVSGVTDMPLEEGDVVVVAEDASAEVALDGGSLITVREKSELKIEKAAKGDSTFFLSIGSLLAKISKLGTARLRVRTPTAVAAVRGTEFGVEVDGDDSHVGVFDEGKVEVTGADGGTPELLISNQETSVKKGAGPLRAEQLKRFTTHRALMRGHGRRLAAIKAKWKALPPEQRGELRKKVLERMREHRNKFIEKRAAQKQKIEDKRRQNAERGQHRRQENLRKMDERRNNINRRKDKR